jgi:predicted NAD/FAD-dependent oxidoreductase
MPREEAARWMQRAFAARLGRPLAQAACTAGFWRQAAPRETLACGHLWDPDCALGFAGDWCLGARVEAAFLSGQGLAKAISAAGPHKMAA